jgi:RES domain-containing protein
VTITAWRIVKARRVAGAFNGEGARVEGGRWNSPGTPIVYTSQSAALAALEMLVHLGRASVLHAYVLIPCTFDAGLVARLDRKRLPQNWRSYPAPYELQLIGDEWSKSATSAVLEVPSAVIETESNYLLNPRHREFQHIRVMDPQPFEFDARLPTALFAI